jgi:hypothetical protein
MAGKTSTSVMQEGHADMAWRHGLESEERERMIREAAYYRFLRRGHAHGHDLDDWLAAEAALLAGRPEPRAPTTADTQAFDMQQHTLQSPMKDEALKRAIRKHPQRDIPRIEGIDPQDAPLKE